MKKIYPTPPPFPYSDEYSHVVPVEDLVLDRTWELQYGVRITAYKQIAGVPGGLHN